MGQLNIKKRSQYLLDELFSHPHQCCVTVNPPTQMTPLEFWTVENFKTHLFSGKDKTLHTLPEGMLTQTKLFIGQLRLKVGLIFEQYIFMQIILSPPELPTRVV